MYKIQNIQILNFVNEASNIEQAWIQGGIRAMILIKFQNKINFINKYVRYVLKLFHHN